MKCEERHGIYEAICNVFGNMETFIREYHEEKHDFQSVIYDNFREKLFKAETYFYEYKSDGKEETRTEDEQENYEKSMHCYFVEELRYIFEEYKAAAKG